jgi:hypothetical protein
VYFIQKFSLKNLVKSKNYHFALLYMKWAMNIPPIIKAPKKRPIENVKTEKLSSHVAIYIPLRPHPNPYKTAPKTS